MTRRSLLIVASGLAVLALTIAGSLGFRARAGAHPDRAYYYWKTQFATSPGMDAALREARVNKLYLRFFDVRWSPEAREPRPVSPVRFNSAPPAGLELVPVVYIVNDVFRRVPYGEVEALADHVAKKAMELAHAEGITYKELQIDCDWSEATKRPYFHFLELLRRKLKPAHVQLSATLRLHQIKYAERTGVPPVDRGMLMFYNFGRIHADTDHSSIFNADDARRYTPYIAGYRLPIGVSLPLFSWVVHSRDGQVLGLMEKFDKAELTPEIGFVAAGTNRFKAAKNFFYHGSYFRRGDLLLVEETTPETTDSAATLALNGVGWRKNFETIALFDLDERNLNRYAHQEIPRILARF